MIDKNNRKDYLAGILYLCIFLFMLVLNKLSVYIADDFRYLYSFNDFKRIESVPQVILSMRAHRYNMNGRLAAHALVQMFGMAPMWLFDLVNALMFTLQIGLIYKISRGNAPRNNLMLLAVFCGVWLFCPAFGQVNLWQDGACNYLWSGVLASLYLLPYLEEYLNNRPVRSNFGKICFLMLSLVMGAYSETVSAAAIGISVLLVIAMMLHCRRKPRPIYWGGYSAGFSGVCKHLYSPRAVAGEAGGDDGIGAHGKLSERCPPVLEAIWRFAGGFCCCTGVELMVTYRFKANGNGINILGRFAGGKFYYGVCQLLYSPFCSGCLCVPVDRCCNPDPLAFGL